MSLNKVSRDETSGTAPAFARLVQSVNNLKMFRMFFLQGFKFFTEKDIFLRYIGVKQLEFRFVVFIGESMVEHLVERGTVELQ